MGRYGLMHKTAVYKLGDAESLLDALYCLSDGDCDFNGENGFDYVCEDAKENGFESNQDYYASLALKELNEGNEEYDLIGNFLNGWLEHDSYYEEWEYDVVKENGIGVISLASLTYC